MAPVKPAVKPSTENYPAQEHDHMQNLVNQDYDPNAASPVIDAWVQFGTKFRELAHDFNKIVNDSQTGYSGAAAEGVRAALTKVSKFADDTGSAFHATAGAIATQRDAAVQAHHSMPKPVDFNPLQIAGKWGAAAVIAPPAMIGGAFEMFSTHNEKVEAKQEAVRVMQQRDTTMMSAAQSLPAMDATPEVTKDQGTTQTSSSTHSQSLSNASTFRPPANTGMPSIPSPNTGNNTTNPAWVAPGLKEPGPGNFNPNNPPGGQNRPPVGPPGLFPPGMRPPGGGQTGRPGGGGTGAPGSGRGGPGGGGGAGSRGMGPGGMAGVGGSGRGMGSFGPATPGGSAGVAGGPGGAAGSSGAGAAGRGGAAGGMGAGGGAGAGKGGGEEDKEHKSNYLVPTDDFFDDDRMVAPPVIGG
ncbi:hypothetical protein SAMN04488564_103679 [Lentzea waywayandensis]|uniref:PPE family protein n=1 Tax=Lentzea waywayandensis TaxID=84724 RepID=A0A1I6E241_9PSEU|nr:hypothetical protein [Lentzea waywayandensis]SFR11844.1 hypothetical protein SAMN04488564_103679 [Lentzea waywayandensis]